MFGIKGYPQVTGFDQCTWFTGCTDEYIAQYIQKIVPPEFLDGCQVIAYYSEIPQGCDSDCCGFWNMQEQKIAVIGCNCDKDPRGTDILMTVMHEIGHNAFAHIPEKQDSLVRLWDGLYGLSLLTTDRKNAFVSQLCWDDHLEDFAETFASCIVKGGRPHFHRSTTPTQAQLLLDIKYDFMNRFWHKTVDNNFANIRLRCMENIVQTFTTNWGKIVGFNKSKNKRK